MMMNRDNISLNRAWILFLCLFPALYFTLNPWTGQPITPDTHGYQQFSSTRDVLYPYLLQWTRAMYGSDIFITYIQLWVRCLATAVLGFAVWAQTGKPLFATAVTLAVLGNPYTYQIDFKVMTDSFFCSAITLFFAVLILFDKTQNLKLLVLLGLLTGLATAIRPIGITLIPLLAFMAFLYKSAFKGHWRCGLAYLLIPLIVVLGASELEHRRLHGANPYLLKHVILLGKAGIMDAPPPANLHYPEVAADLYKDMQPKFADLRAEKDLLTYLNKTWRYENYVFFHYSKALILKIAQERGIPFQNILADMGKDYIRAYPLLYLKDAVIHYLGSWVIFNERDLNPAQHFVRYAIYGIGLFTFGFVFVGLFWLARKGPAYFPDTVRVPWLAALYLQGYTLFIGLFSIFASRYMSSVSPIMCLSAGLPLLYFVEPYLMKLLHKDQKTHG